MIGTKRSGSSVNSMLPPERELKRSVRVCRYL